MDSTQAKEKIRLNGEENKMSIDPFAADIFADSTTKEDLKIESAAPDETAKEKPEWIWRLPKAARPAVDWDWLWRNLPADFSDDLPRRLADALARYLNLTGENLIEFIFFIKRETSEMPANADDSWWVRIGIETSDAEFAVEINKTLAIWLVDAMLGEEISDDVQARDFTRSETAVLEFLGINLVNQANGIINAPLFKFLSISQLVPAGLVQKSEDDFNGKNPASVIVSSWQTVHGFQQSIVKLYLTAGALTALQSGENKLLTAAPRKQLMWNSLKNRVKNVRARLFLGETQTTLDEIAGLEKGDVALLENYNFSFYENAFDGTAEIFLGDGEQIKISGAFHRATAAPPNDFEKSASGDDNEFLVRPIKSSQIFQVAVEYIEELENSEEYMPEENTGKSVEREAIEMAGNFDDEQFSGTGVPLENLSVTLRVELEARRMSLAEVGNIRVNQIIELGARATDPVNLLIDDKIVARGELVEVENQLGVRIIQILR